MTEKETTKKAQDLYDFFDNYPLTIHWKKECALKVADELIEAFKQLSIQESGKEHIDFVHSDWQRVKIKIEKL